MTATEERLWALLRMVKAEPSLARVRDVKGHDLIHGVISEELRISGKQTGPDYWDLSRSVRCSVTWSDDRHLPYRENHFCSLNRGHHADDHYCPCGETASSASLSS